MSENRDIFDPTKGDYEPDVEAKSGNFLGQDPSDSDDGGDTGGLFGDDGGGTDDSSGFLDAIDQAPNKSDADE